jgi:hypothetical protein
MAFLMALFGTKVAVAFMVVVGAVAALAVSAVSIVVGSEMIVTGKSTFPWPWKRLR